MKRCIRIFAIAGFLFFTHAEACVVLLSDSIALPLNSADMGNSDRLSVVRHYLTAREWTSEGARAEIDASAYKWEHEPTRLAKERGERLRRFLIQLGMNSADIFLSDHIVANDEDKLDDDEKKQLGVQFFPKCPSTGCQYLCNTAGTQGAASHAITPTTPGPTFEHDNFNCGNVNAPPGAHVFMREQWTPKTIDTSIVLMKKDGTPFSNVCYRITTSATQHMGITDATGRTDRVQMLGAEYTKIEIKLDPTVVGQ